MNRALSFQMESIRCVVVVALVLYLLKTTPRSPPYQLGSPQTWQLPRLVRCFVEGRGWTGGHTFPVCLLLLLLLMRLLLKMDMLLSWLGICNPIVVEVNHNNS